MKLWGEGSWQYKKGPIINARRCPLVKEGLDYLRRVSLLIIRDDEKGT
jgi:hypothetical protein